MLWITTRAQVQYSSDLVRDFEMGLDLLVLITCLLVFRDKSFENIIQIEGEMLFCIEFTFSALPLCLYRLRTVKCFKILMFVYLLIYRIYDPL